MGIENLQTSQPSNLTTAKIEDFLAQDEKKDLLRLLTAGSVDDGKSTLIGRLLHDSKRLYDDQLESLKRDSKRVGNAGEEIDYALLLDGLKAEREQGITIDVAYRYFATSKRKFIIADTPGHEQYTRNMVTGASTAHLAIVLIDARKGVITQTKRHSFLISLLGIKHVIIAVNKMDLVDYDQAIFDNICQTYMEFTTRLNIPDMRFIPLSALKGDNIVDAGPNMPWYHGPSIMHLLETIPVSADRNFVDFRFPIQYVSRPDLDFRGYAGRIASGILRKGEEVVALPTGKTTRVATIESMGKQVDYAFPPASVMVTLEDEIDISRGDMLVRKNNQPHVGRHFEAMLVWMDETPMDLNQQFIIKHTTQKVKARLDLVRYQIDVNTTHRSESAVLKLNQIGRVVLTASRPLLFDSYRKNRQTGSFILIDPITNNTSAVGMIVDRIDAEKLPSRISSRSGKELGRTLISREEREKQIGQTAKTYWITGLHASGKNELAYRLEHTLFDQGKTVVVLDGNELRTTLNQELGFNKADRDENLRRVAEIAKLLNNQGLIVIAVFISPDKATREQVREIIGAQRFKEIFVDTPLEVCKSRDKKGLYQKADDGLLDHFPGVDFEYESGTADLVVADIETIEISDLI
ncbi:MAG: sulfate adenylyltransferase subunit CysN [Candidatus Marinimicrobia bacterium]|nr:sulfate adenylyltransferase subunit CysN [Candidatus Neomarinimicrobiota bacterium]